MAEDYDYDIDGFDDDAWLYVDDEFDLADELAEGQVPEPGYAGNNAEIDSESYDYEFYQYWDDLEYGDDAYWDVGLAGAEDDKAGVKRKQDTAAKGGPVDKKRRTDLLGHEVYRRELDPLIFCSRAERIRPRRPDLLRKDTVKFSLIPDWRKRFAHEDGLVGGKEMPLDMKRAAEAKVPESPPKERQAGEEAYSETADIDDEEDWAEDDNDEDGAPPLDLDVLKEILKQKLGEAGLDGMDENAFMGTISKMLSSGDDADDPAGELADSLLGKLTSDSNADEGEALSGWLSQQGVVLNNRDEVDDASSAATMELHASRMFEQHGTERRTACDETPLHVGPSSNRPSTTQKRSAEGVIDDNTSTRHKKVTFDGPHSVSSSDPAALPADASVLTGADSHVPAPTLESPSTQKARTSARPSAATRKKFADEPVGAVPADGKQKSKPETTSRKRKTTSATAEDDSLEEKPAREKRTRTSTRAAMAQKTSVRLSGSEEAETPAPSTRHARSTRSRAAKET